MARELLRTPPSRYAWALHPQEEADTSVEGFPFKARFGDYGKPISCFRAGIIQVRKGGIRIEGQAVPDHSFSLLLLLSLCLTISLFVWLKIPLNIAAFHNIFAAIEGIFCACILAACELIRVQDALDLTWNDVHELLYVPKKSLVCLAYKLPTANSELCSLTFKLDKERYDQFTASVGKYAEVRMRQGKLREKTSPLVLFLVVSSSIILMAAAFLLFM